MRTVASYALERSSGDISSSFDAVRSAVTRWLISKGWSEGQAEFRSTHGTPTRVARLNLDVPDGRLERTLVVETLPEGIFYTAVSTGHNSERCALHVELRVEGTSSRLQPFRFDARRPKFLAELLRRNHDWQLGDTPLTDHAYVFAGAKGGRDVAEVIWHAERTVPVVLISTINGHGITSDFVSKLAGDLCGLAIVATVDEEASWEITRKKGIEWSCFGGALRLYWPLHDGASRPQFHPLWLRKTMLSNGDDPGRASYVMRAQLRRTILGVSAISIREPRLIRDLDRAYRKKRQDELREALARSQSDQEYQNLAESYAQENDRLREDLREKEDRLAMLEDQISGLQLALRYVDNEANAVPPDAQDEPKTVREAVDRAITEFSDWLLFSDSVYDGVDGLNPSAGPPLRIFEYLRALHSMAYERAARGLGVGVVQWLERQGVACSIESETVRNAGGRQWNFQGDKVSFDFHLKPSDGVSPDRCVRIYFDIAPSGKIRIGWIGRHPE